jgi:hypothetical protein
MSIFSDYMAKAPKYAAPKDNEAGNYVCPLTVMNLRDGPGSSFAKVGTSTKGAKYKDSGAWAYERKHPCKAGEVNRVWVFCVDEEASKAFWICWSEFVISKDSGAAIVIHYCLGTKGSQAEGQDFYDYNIQEYITAPKKEIAEMLSSSPGSNTGGGGSDGYEPPLNVGGETGSNTMTAGLVIGVGLVAVLIINALRKG